MLQTEVEFKQFTKISVDLLFSAILINYIIVSECVCEFVSLCWFFYPLILYVCYDDADK